MKTPLFYSSLLLCCFVNAQTINIPDANFKNKLLEADALINNIATDADGNPITIDSNHNNQIEISEALSVYRLFIPYCNINNLVGIENFTNLIFINCAHNNLINIDLLNQLNNLQEIGCDYNYLTTLSLNNLTDLKYLLCNNNQLSTIDFSNNPTLQKVYCGNNQITSLNFSNNPLFNDLGCKNNPNLASINISNGTTQLFGPTTWLNECWTGCPNLSTICADSNEIPALQNYLDNCGVDTSVITIKSNCSLGVEEYNNYSVNVYPNPSNRIFTISIKNNATLEIYTILGKVLLKQDVSSNLENTIDLTNYATGIYFAKITDNNNNSKIVKLIKK